MFAKFDESSPRETWREIDDGLPNRWNTSASERVQSSLFPSLLFSRKLLSFCLTFKWRPVASCLESSSELLRFSFAVATLFPKGDEHRSGVAFERGPKLHPFYLEIRVPYTSKLKYIFFRRVCRHSRVPPLYWSRSREFVTRDERLTRKVRGSVRRNACSRETK